VVEVSRNPSPSACRHRRVINQLVYTQIMAALANNAESLWGFLRTADGNVVPMGALYCAIAFSISTLVLSYTQYQVDM
jgi:hypothetical protein